MWLLQSRREKTDSEDALEVLRARLARGDIDVQEFEERAAALPQTERRTSRRLVIAVIAAVALLIAVPTVIMAANGWDMDMWDMHGQGDDTSGDAVVRGGSAENVRINDFAFEPGNLEVPVGASITWRNDDSAPHDATARDGSWPTARLLGRRERYPDVRHGGRLRLLLLNSPEHEGETHSRLTRGAHSMEWDVVCGMDVDPKTAPAQSEYNGKKYYFCAPGCKKQFDADPAKFLK